jgi:hypothetical protein
LTTPRRPRYLSSYDFIRNLSGSRLRFVIAQSKVGGPTNASTVLVLLLAATGRQGGENALSDPAAKAKSRQLLELHPAVAASLKPAEGALKPAGNPALRLA